MSLGADEVKAIANLARLAIADEEIPGYRRELSAILALAEQLRAVDTSQVEPLAHPLEMSQRLRPDLVTEPDPRAKLQACAPQVEAGLYLVPKVIE
jgi:aspartyl-tRNA(Asn)/glutamyl-tRNA(Gln) amidotransferase subunit C